MKRNYRFASVQWRRQKPNDLIGTVFAILLSVSLVSFTPSDSYAMDSSGKVKWSLIYISANPGCSNYQYQMANAYSEMTAKYFELYQFENSNHPQQCMPDTKYAEYEIPGNIDLLILVYDKQIGKKELHQIDIGSFYSHLGPDRTKNHIVVLCDCPTHGFSYPQFTLGHELSHFITYYLGFEMSVHDEIHEISAKYNECSNSHWNEKVCPGVVERIEGDRYFTHAMVMAPYQPAIGKKIILHDANGVNDPADSEILMNLQKEITKWWIAGKINDTDYTGVLEQTFDITDTKTDLPENILLAAARNGQEDKDIPFDAGSENTQKILKRVPFRETSDTPDKTEIPEWFRSIAYEWSQNHSSNEDFINSIRHLLGAAS